MRCDMHRFASIHVVRAGQGYDWRHTLHFPWKIASWLASGVCALSPPIELDSAVSVIDIESVDEARQTPGSFLAVLIVPGGSFSKAVSLRANSRGITVCGTQYQFQPTVRLTNR